MDVVTNLRRHAANQPEKLALVDGRRRWSFRDLWRDSVRFANAVSGLGCGPGERVAIVTANRAEHVIALYGTAVAGAVAVPLPARMPAEQLGRTIADAGAAAVVWGNAPDAVPAELLDAVPARRCIGVDGPVPGGHALSELLGAASDSDPRVPVRPEDDLVVLYSSGTTGTPKGMVLSHACRVAYALGFSVEFGVGRDDVFAMLTPIYHNGAEMWLHSILYAGGTVTLLDDVGQLLPGAAGGGPTPTASFMMPAQLRDLGEQADGVERPPLTVVTGAMPVPAALKRETIARLPWCRLFEAYGLTEAGVLTILRPDEHEAHGDSIGRPFVDCELRVVDPETGAPAGSEGELTATGPCLMTGYHARDDLDEQCLVDGFFRTGDLVRRDADGYFHLLDRKDDLIVSGGVNVFARDVEEVVAAHPAVAETCVVGVADDRWGAAVTAAVVVGAPFEPEELIDYCRGRLSPPQVPKRVLLVEELPRNEQGKVLRREVRRLAAGGERDG